LSDTEYLTLEDALGLIEVLKVGPIRDSGLLDTALAHSRSSPYDQDAYSTPERKASALLHSLVQNHPFVDANKRLEWLSTAVFLLLNGHGANLGRDDAFALVLEVVSGSLELELIAHRLGVQTISEQDDS